MRIVPLSDIQSAIDPNAAIEAVKAGFIAHAKGQVHCPEPMQIVFRDDRGEHHGECHVKSATWEGLPYAAVKIASGSYRNAARGLPGAGGMIILIASDTGLPEAILHDDCWLTNVRTAAAGALAAGLKPVSKDGALGVIGTGTQAEIQAEMISAHLGLGSVCVWGRNPAKAAALCERLKAGGLEATPMATVRELCHSSAILVTTTPVTKPVVRLEDVPETLHIVAVGADTPGKTNSIPASWAGPTPSSPTRTRSVSATATSAPRCAPGRLRRTATAPSEKCSRAPSRTHEWRRTGFRWWISPGWVFRILRSRR